MSTTDETMPLVPKSPKLIWYDEVDELSSIDEVNGRNALILTREAMSIGKSSIPLTVTFFLQYSLTVVSIFSVGQMGKEELAAISLAIMTLNVSISVFNGMATCLDTFCAQAYGGKKYHLVGLYFQRCTAMILVFAIPIMIMWYYSGYLLSFIVPQDEKKLVLLAQTYLRYISFGAPGYIFFETGKRFLQAQHIFTAGQYSLFIVAPINVLLNYLLVWNSRVGLGFIGAPISTAISYWLMSFILLGYAIFIDGKECWFGLNVRESFNFKEWGSMMSLALNGTAMLLSEFVAFEILTLSASRFGTSSLAAQSIASTVATLSFQIPFAVSVAVSTQLANYIGAQNLQSANTTLRVARIFAFGLGLVNCVVLVVFGKSIAASFTNEDGVTNLAVVVLRILGINQLYDCPNILFAGCLRGQGRQHVGSILNLLAYYVLAVPLALVLGFRFQFGLFGLWSGLGVGIFTLASSEYWFLKNSNWDAILLASRHRNFYH